MTDVLHLIDLQPPRRRPRRAKTLAVVGLASLAVVTLLALARDHRGLVLMNDTPSEPPGLYVRAAHDPIRPGTIIAFLAPPPAFPYADRRARFLHTTPIIKAVAAVAGDEVCTTAGVLTINGVRRAPIRARDSQGYTLPHWTACRHLEPGELFVYSDRVPNSFDSRYYGPVSASRAQAYRPLITTNGIGR
jgi:conjugative transfer signal peptidase TraF